VERVRKRSPVQSRAGAEEFERQLRQELLKPPVVAKEVPTFAEYANEFMRTYAVANNKPSEQHQKRTMLKHHLLPAFGPMQLDAIKVHAIEKLKAKMLEKGSSRKLVNNVLACLGKMLRYAHQIEVLDSVPSIQRLKIAPQKFDFFTYEELARVLAAAKGDPQWYALLLVGADAGLRQGEMVALEWGDIDLVAGTLTVRRSSWRGIVGSPKSGCDRKLPLTDRLRSALKAARHLRGERVFSQPSGTPLTQSAIECGLMRISKRAGLRRFGTHVLRHTFCSHLAMRGAAPKAIQELAGHTTLTMTLRYMHLAPSALREAIGLLDSGQPVGIALEATS
jgi:integrase